MRNPENGDYYCLVFVLFFCFRQVSWEMGKRWQKPGERSRQYRAFSLERWLLQYNDIAHHCVLRRRREGRKQGDTSSQGRATDKSCYFLEHSFVCLFHFQFHFPTLFGNTGVCIFLALLFSPARHRPSENPCDEVHLLRMS